MSYPYDYMDNRSQEQAASPALPPFQDTGVGSTEWAPAKSTQFCAIFQHASYNKGWIQGLNEVIFNNLLGAALGHEVLQSDASQPCVAGHASIYR